MKRKKRGSVLTIEYVLISVISLIILVVLYNVVSSFYVTLEVKKDVEEKLPKLQYDIKNYITKAITQGSYTVGEIYIPDYTSIHYDGNVVVISYSNPSLGKTLYFRVVLPCVVQWYSLPSSKGIYRIEVEVKIVDNERICSITTIPI